MNTTIDQRVVEMRFDNKQFESNVATSMSTLDKLKARLNLTGASKGLENVGAAAKNVSFAGLNAGIETVQAKFSALQVMGVTALANITNAAINTGKRMVSALTIDPIKTGFQEYETQINAVQTILANTSHKGTNINDVNKALDTLNTYADKTIYNFTEMTRNIGTFTAAGVDLDTSVKSIQGIANLAAVSGSTSQQASTAMYQLSQALAAGRVTLMDWNSVVNAGMGGEVFQNALKRTAEAMGTNVDAMIEKYGSFRESLTQGEWLTAEVLTKTLEQFTMSAKEGTKQWEEYKKSLMADGYTEAQAEEILKMANTATDAATKVKTFSQLWDTMKEAAQSGWAQTWRILIGDFEEAKELLTNISDVINNFITKSAESRNKMLEGWDELGGRADLIEGLGNAFKFVISVLKPIGEAFREIFSPITSQQLYDFTAGFKEFTSHLKLTDEQAGKIKSTFKGLFAVADIFFTIIKEVAGGVVKVVTSLFDLAGGIVSVTGSFGDWLVNLRDSIKEVGFFEKVIGSITDFLTGVIEKIKDFGSAIRESFEAPSFDGFVGFLKFVFDIIQKIGTTAGEVFSSLADGLANAFGESGAGDLINGGLFGGLLTGLIMFIKKLSSPFEAGVGFLENVTGILEDVRGCMQAYQSQLKADALIKIATAIAILAGSILILASIDGASLAQSLAAITVLFAELVIAFKAMGGIEITAKGVLKAIPMMIGISTAIVILAGAMKILSSINVAGIAKGLVAIGILMAELGIFLNKAKFSGKVTLAAGGIVILSSAMLILAKAVEQFGGMSWGELSKGLVSIGALLAEVAIFSKISGSAKHVISTATSMVILGAAMKLFAEALKSMSSMSWEELGRGLVGMAGALVAIGIAAAVMPKNMLGMGIGILAVGAAMQVLGDAMAKFSGMSWQQIGTGLAAMGGALLELAIALNLMRGTIGGATALIIAAGALAILAPVMKSLGGMSWAEIGKGLVTIAGAFAVMGVAGMLLAPLIPAILGLTAALALLGVAAIGIGAGITLIGIGLTTIATGLTAVAAGAATSATAIVAALTIIITGIAELIPTLAEKFGEAIVVFCGVIGDCAPQIADSLLKLITEVLGSIAEYAPQIVDSLMVLLIGVLDSLATRVPELVAVAIEVIAAFFQGVIDALSGFDTTSIVQTIAGVGLIAGLMFALSALTGLIPGAMLGVLGMGVVIAELALVLAAIGALAQIPGLDWLISEGGNFLQTIGTAIGQFIGGIAGGIAQGATSTLPQIGTDLSNFMTNIQPFIDGVKGLDESMFGGIKALAGAILTLTAADILDSLTSWITGGSSLSTFAEDLVPFGAAMKQYAAEVNGLNVEAINLSVSAAKSLVAVAKAIPEDGFLGLDGIDDFGDDIVDFAKSLKKYAEEVVGIDGASVIASVFAAKGLVAVAKAIPDDGTFGTDGIDDFGDNIVDFAKSLKKYSKEIAEVNTTSITASAASVNKLVGAINGLAGLDTSGVSAFKSAINSLAETNISGLVKTFSASTAKLNNVGANMVNALVKGVTGKKGSMNTAANSLLDAFSKGLSSKKAASAKSINDMISTMLKTIKSKNASFKGSGVDVMKQFVSGINSKKSTVSKTMTTTLNSSITSIRSKYSGFYSAGRYLVQGFANGISANTFMAVAKARAMANAAEEAAKAALGERSPSRVFYGIGKYVVLGFTNALGDYSSAVYKASSGMADYARSGMTKAVGRINTLLDSTMDVRPTITPVLDLSNVEAGAGAIGGLFTNPALTTLGNLGSISVGMRRLQNGFTNEDVVSAINKLRKEVGSISKPSYNIAGINYNDDVDVANAINTLVRATKINRRS